MSSSKNMFIFLILIILLIPDVAHSGNPKISLFSTKDKKKSLVLKANDVDDYSTYVIDIVTNDKREFRGNQGETKNENIYFIDNNDSDCVIKTFFDKKNILHVGQVKCFRKRTIYDYFAGEYTFVKNLEVATHPDGRKTINTKIIKVLPDPNVYGKTSVTIAGEDWFPIIPVSNGLISNKDYDKLVALGTRLENTNCNIVLYNNGKGWAIIGFVSNNESFTAEILNDSKIKENKLNKNQNAISSSSYVNDESIEKRTLLKKNISLTGIVKYYPGAPDSGDIPNYFLQVSETEGHIICFCGSSNFQLGCDAFSGFDNNLNKSISLVGDYMEIENDEGSYKCINLMPNK